MKLALHVCCGICMKYPAIDLIGKGYKPEAIYFNPNIQPYDEFLNRAGAVKQLVKDIGVNLLVPEYDQESEESGFFIKTAKNRLEQCEKCYSVRLKYTAKYAKSNNIRYFSTSLLGSPYQKKDLIRKIAGTYSREFGLEFIEFGAEWETHYFESRNYFRAKGLYSQKYCGCIYSKMDVKQITNHKHQAPNKIQNAK